MSKVTVEHAVAVLNEALALDPKAIGALLATRIPCNAELAEHPTIQVCEDPRGKTTVGILGMLNGIFGVTSKGNGFIKAVLDDSGAVESFNVSGS